MITYFKHLIAILLFCSIYPCAIYGQARKSASISGYLSIDATWDSILYLSHLPTFDDLYVMSNEMIIAKTGIDGLGYFKFDIDFLPAGENLYRLHIVKKGDTPATLIIGGKDENHMFLIASRFSNIELSCHSTSPPFKNVWYKNSTENTAFQQISKLVFEKDSLAAESTASKRLLIENQLQKDLLLIADTTNNFLVSLFAIYKSKYESNYSLHLDFYKTYLKKWKHQTNDYYKAFAKRLPVKNETNILLTGVMLAIVLAGIGFFIGKKGLAKTTSIEKLSIQERKIYELLEQGASNQEISDHFNIGLSTVKSHVSSIYSKLHIKSRKDILDRKKSTGY